MLHESPFVTINNITESINITKSIINSSIEIVDPLPKPFSPIIEEIIEQPLEINDLDDIELIDNLQTQLAKKPDQQMYEYISSNINDFVKNKSECYVVILETKDIKEQNLRHMIDFYIKTIHNKKLDILIINKNKIRCILQKKYHSPDDLLLYMVNGIMMEKLTIDDKVKSNIELISKMFDSKLAMNEELNESSSFEKKYALKNYSKQLEYILNCMNIPSSERELYVKELEYVNSQF